jgi:hypothetical protein
MRIDGSILVRFADEAGTLTAGLLAGAPDAGPAPGVVMKGKRKGILCES